MCIRMSQSIGFMGTIGGTVRLYLLGYTQMGTNVGGMPDVTFLPANFTVSIGPQFSKR